MTLVKAQSQDILLCKQARQTLDTVPINRIPNHNDWKIKLGQSKLVYMF